LTERNLRKEPISPSHFILNHQCLRDHVSGLWLRSGHRLTAWHTAADTTEDKPMPSSVYIFRT